MRLLWAVSLPFLLLAQSTYAQEQPIRLQCEGMGNVGGLKNMPIAGIFVEIGGGTVTVYASCAFDGVYQIVGANPGEIAFENTRNVWGNINRTSGVLMLANQSTGALTDVIFADCKVARPLF